MLWKVIWRLVDRLKQQETKTHHQFTPLCPPRNCYRFTSDIRVIMLIFTWSSLSKTMNVPFSFSRSLRDCLVRAGLPVSSRKSLILWRCRFMNLSLSDLFRSECWCCPGFFLLGDILTVNQNSFNPLHPNISMHILHTVLYIFPKVLTRRICLIIKSFSSWRSFLFSWS